MRVWLVVAMTAALAGCGKADGPGPSGQLPASRLAGADDPFWTAAFAPIAQSGDEGPGDLSFGFHGFGRAGALQFSRGLVLQTQPIGQPPVTEAYAAAGPESWGDLLSLPKTAEIELRSVTSTAGPPGVQGLCGDQPTTFVAIGIRPGLDRPGSISLAAFSGADAPGPDAKGSNACGVLEFALPG